MGWLNGKQGSGDDGDNESSSPTPPPSSLQDKMKGNWANIKYSTVLATFKLKKRTKISILEYRALRVKGKFGKDYLDLVGDSAPVYDLEDCLGINLQEFFDLKEKIKANLELIKEKELQIKKKINAAHGIEDEEDEEDEDPDATEKQVRFKMPSKSVMTSSRSVGGTKLSPKKTDTIDFNYDSDGGNTAEMSLSDRPLRTVLKGPGERKYDSDSGANTKETNTASLRPKRRRKKGTSQMHKNNSRGYSYNSESGDKIEMSTRERPKRRPKIRSGQRTTIGSESTTSSTTTSRSGNTSRVVTTTTSATPKRKPKKAAVKRQSDDSVRSNRSNAKVVTTTTRPKRKKMPAQ